MTKAIESYLTLPIDDINLANRELQAALDRQAATNEILHIISNSPTETQPVFEAIVLAGAKLFPGAAISIALPVDDSVDAVAVADEDADRADAWRKRFPIPLTRNYMHGKAILDCIEIDIPDVANSPNKDSAGAKNFLVSGYRAVTMMPMVRNGEAIGVLGIVRLAPGHLAPEQMNLLRAFAAQALIAIENARLMSELKDTNSMLGKVSNQLAKYISPQLYQSIVSGEADVTIKSQRKKLTIFFSDIAGFTEITDRLESEELTALLNEYLSEMSKIAEKHGANFDKFIGDAIMCYFGDPESKGVKEDAAACVRMALEMRDRLNSMQTDWRDQGLIDRPFLARMGINTGYCTVGNFGSQDRMDYTIIGNQVNLASRLESHADAGGILLAAETYSLVSDWLMAEERDAITVKGIPAPVKTYSVRGTFEELAQEETFIHYEGDGLTITFDGARTDRKKARKILEQALAQLDRSKHG